MYHILKGIRFSMRLNQKRQILQLISTINEGLDYASNSDLDKSISMLYDCYEGLLFLSELLKDENKICKFLQRAIDSTQLIISNKQEIDFIGKIKKSLKDLNYLVNNELNTEIEIAFMPYKVSMWDSLDSIYREAEKDPNCTCYVVPIPYYEKNTNGELINFCYEGDQFPKDINITLFETYDFEKRQPDIIYIHNPYDEFNYLTTVHPRYFSKNLAQYTNMLVYVPYFIAGSMETKKFNLLPSYKRVTKIITQSNTQKESYIASGMGEDRIINLGSPKIDAMLKVERDQKEIPFYWEEIISNKKVILFNTGITNLLENADNWINEIEEILNVFIKNSQSVFIWRPHPLTEITIKTMRPNILEEFEKIVKKVKLANNIIIDKNRDVYPAVAVSDGLISDYSSIMLQYIITGKPILGMLSEEMIDKERFYLADYLGCYFTIQDISVSQFTEMVEQSIDLKKEERISRFKNSICNADGTCGQKIHQKIKNEVLYNQLTDC